MSPRRERSRWLSLAGIGAVAALVAAASAFGYVSIYNNTFNSKSKYREIKKIGKSDRCDREYKEGRGVMEVWAKQGPRQCWFAPPVQGVSPRPDHRFDAAGRVMRETPKGLRRHAFLTLALRVGGGNRYDLRVFPKDRRFQLRRSPDGAGFPVAADSNAVAGIGQLNKMALIAEGARVRALVNGTEVANVVDPNPNDVKGRKLEFGVGSVKEARGRTVANYDRLKVSVPDP